jgi:hypothetical protein
MMGLVALIISMASVMVISGIIFLAMHEERMYQSEYVFLKRLYVFLGWFTLFIMIAFCALIVKVLAKSYIYYLIN